MNKKGKVLAFISLSIACFLTVLDGTIVNVSLPTMAKYFNTDLIGISWVSIAYLIPFSALIINFSKIADIYGRKKLFIIGLVVFGLASICCGISTTFPMIIIFRIIQGVGAAILTPLAIPLAIEIFGIAGMSKLAIMLGMIISISAASGPVLGGILNEIFGFKAIFYVNIPFILISLFLGIKYVRECYDKTIEKKVDIVGSILLTYGLGALTFLLVKGNDYGWGSNKITVLIITSLITIVMFLVYERKIKYPMIDFKLFETRSFTSSIVLISVIFFGFMPISYLMNFYLENQLGYTVLKSGFIIGIVSAVSVVVSPVFGLLTKRTSARVTSFLAVIFVTLGDLIFMFINSENNMKIIYSSFILIGLAVGATAPLYQSAFEEISQDKNGNASGILNCLRQLTACIAIALVATLSSHYTTIAVNETQKQIINKVNENKIIEQQFKYIINSKIKTSKSDSGNSFSKAMVHSLIQKQEKIILVSVPYNTRNVVTNKFTIQEKEINNIVEEGEKIKVLESNKVYSKCFLIIGIIAAFGLIAAPFNTKK
jgi:EmrB/QacA subfamily drug resistance transporter